MAWLMAVKAREGCLDRTQLHLLKVVISQRLMALESLTLVDEDQGT